MSESEDYYTDPPCEICPNGYLINGEYNLGIPSLPGGGTCASAASFGLGSCFDEVHCLYLQLVFEDACCLQASPELPTPIEGMVLDSKNNTISPSPMCNDNKESQKNSTSMFPGGSDDRYCYSLEAEDETAYEICLENVFGDLCLATFDGIVCDSCELGATIDKCPENMSGTRVDCSNINSALDLDLCNDGEVIEEEVPDCVEIVDLEIDEIFSGTVDHQLCFDDLNEDSCTASLDGVQCRYCKPGTKSTSNCPYTPGIIADCSNVKASFNMDLCNDGEVLQRSNSDLRNHESGGSKNNGGKGGNIFVFIAVAALVVLAVLRRVRNSTKYEGFQSAGNMELTDLQLDIDESEPVVVATAVMT